MNNDLKILLLNVGKMDFTNKETGEVREMTKIQYGIICMEDERFVGYSVLDCYTKSTAFDIAKKYVGKVVPATISTKPTNNGVKYLLQALNGEKFE